MIFLQISYELDTNILWTSYKCLINLLQILTNFLQLSYELLTNFVWISYEFLYELLGIFWTSYKFLSNHLWTSCESFMIIFRTSYTLFANLFELESCHVNLAFYSYNTLYVFNTLSVSDAMTYSKTTFSIMTLTISIKYYYAYCYIFIMFCLMSCWWMSLWWVKCWEYLLKGKDQYEWPPWTN